MAQPSVVYFINASKDGLTQKVQTLIDTAKVAFFTRSPILKLDQPQGKVLFILVVKPGDRINWINAEFLGYTADDLKTMLRPTQLELMVFFIPSKGISTQEFSLINHLSPDQLTVCQDDHDVEVKVINYLATMFT